MASKKFYSDDDIQLAKAALSELPDLTAQRKTLRDFLDAIRDDIIVLVRTKGYTLADVRDTLKNAGYEVGEKALRDIIREAESKKPSRRSSSKTAPKKTDSGRKDGIAYSALFDHGLASKSDQRFASIRSTGNLTFSTAF